MSKLTEIQDDFAINSQGDLQSLEEAITQHKAFKQSVNAIGPRQLEATGWKPTQLYASYANTPRLFRKSESANDAKIALWMAQAHKLASDFFVEHSAMPEFTGLSKEDVKDIAQLSVDENILPQLPKILAYKGIILIYLRAMEGSKVDGATFLFANKYPVVVHAARFDRLDNFWFTLIHELSHVCLHFQQLATPIVDIDIFSENAPLSQEETDIEIQANRLTRFSFIPKTEWRTTPKNIVRLETIEEIAKRNKIHPAVIAGLIRYGSKNYTLFSDLVNSVNVTERLFPK